MIHEIYQAFAEESSGVDFACGPGCATCCTRSVTLTTGEGRLIVDFLRRLGHTLPELPRDPAPLRPALTINGLAACCLVGQEPPAEAEAPWLFEPCFFLREGLCSIYEIRPFACRSLVSTVNCKNTGMAEAPERLVTLAIVTNQILEDLDRGGWWGNLADVLAFLDEGAADASRLAARERLLPNLPLPGFLLGPEEQEMVENYLAMLGKVADIDFGGRSSGRLPQEYL